MDDEPLPEKKRRIRPELVFSLLSLFSSVCAVAITGAQTEIVARQQEASVWPYVELNQAYSADSFEFSITNKGIGPAKIKSLTYEYQGKTYSGTELLIRAIFNDSGRSIQNFNVAKVDRSVLAVGEQQVDLGLRVSPDDRVQGAKAMQQLAAALPNIRARLEYESVYGTRWENVNDEVRLLR